MITQMTKLKRDTIRRTTESLASQIRRKLLTSTNFEIVTAASLAHHGMLGFVEDMWLGQGDVDLASIPAEHMASLASCVTRYLDIYNISCDLTPILDNIKCEDLRIDGHSLGTEETWALVRAMEASVSVLRLGINWFGTTVSLDIRALTLYSGHGKCWKVIVDHTCTCMTEMKNWAQGINWLEIDLDHFLGGAFVLQRPK